MMTNKFSKLTLVVAALLYGGPPLFAAQEANDDALPTIPEATAGSFDPATVDQVQGGKTRGLGGNKHKLPPAPTTKQAIIMAMQKPAGKDRGFGVRESSNKARVYVQFETGSAQIMTESYPLLDEWGEALQSPELANVSLEVAGHTDSVGSADANLVLAEQRAKAVVDYFVDKFKFDSGRFKVVSYGESQPYASNATAAGRTLNRRVEFVRGN